MSARPWEETAEARTNGQIAAFFSLPETGSWLIRPVVRVVPLDIRPGSCSNPLKPAAHGVLPVGLLAEPEFDLSRVDLASLLLVRADGVGGAVSPLVGPSGPSPRFEDVSRPVSARVCDEEETGCGELDGLADWLLFFDLQEVADLVAVEPRPPAVAELVLTGRLWDGTPLAGQDCVVILGADR